MITHGMNVGEVRHVARGLHAQAAALQAACTEVDRLVLDSLAQWKGPDSQRFAGVWRGSTRSLLRDLSSAMDELARTAAANADRQEEVSRDLIGSGDGGALGPSASGFPGGPVNSVHHVLDMMMLARAAYPDGHGGLPVELIEAEEAAGTKRTGASADRDRPNIGYTHEHGYVPAGWEELSHLDLEKLGLSQADLHDPTTGFDASIFRGEDGRIVVAFRGTDELLSLSGLGGALGLQQVNGDTHNNTKALLGWAPQDELAARLALKLDAGLLASGGDPHNVSYTGHSLGGRNAMIASLVTGNEALAVNGLNVSKGAYEEAMKLRVPGAADHKIVMIADHNDSVSLLTPNGLPAEAYQKLVTTHSEQSLWLWDFPSEQEQGHVLGSAYEGYREAVIQSGNAELLREADAAREIAEEDRRRSTIPYDKVPWF